MSQLEQSTESPSMILARSAFGFALLVFLVLLITTIWVLLAPPSPSPLFRQLQVGIQVGAGVVTLFSLWLTVRFYRTPPTEKQANGFAAVLQRGVVAWMLMLLLIQVNFIARFALRDIAPSLTNPAEFALAGLSLVMMGMIYAVHRDRVTRWFEQTRKVWTNLGVLVSVIAMLGGLFIINRMLVGMSGINDVLRGGLDYRPLAFYDDGNPQPSASAFWREQAQLRVRWSPYTYWVMDAFDGEFINISNAAIRYTPDYGAADDAATIAVFGGSTVWGEGARDAYTIPGHLARLLWSNQNRLG